MIDQTSTSGAMGAVMLRRITGISARINRRCTMRWISKIGGWCASPPISSGPPLALMLGLAILILSRAGSAAAQNVSVSDYEVPISRADILRIDAFSFNYVTEGEEAVVQTGDLTVVYKKFYESQPYAYSIDLNGGTSFNKDNINDKWTGNLLPQLKTNFKKYRTKQGNLFFSWGTDSRHDVFWGTGRSFDRPMVDMTVGVGYGRFINATALRKAVRIEEFFLDEGIISEHLPKGMMIEFAHIIERESEYKEIHGNRYQNYWFEDMLAEIEKSGQVHGEIGYGLLRMQEVLFKERINDRFYGWDLTAGVQFEVLTPFEGQDRRAPALSFNFRYSRPLSWSTQINTDLNADTPFSGDFGRVYNISQDTDFIYEITNKVSFTTFHTFRINKRSGMDARLSTSISIAFNFFIENKINLALSESITTVEGEPFRQSFNVGLSYRIF
ncbi:MAG TPA: hypothetical protein DIU35_06150 [Candidatus Latescibacteria bacterium]|nr:hypothetical protein [Gemmatimonadota bacterium]HCR17047.1 hypothetical protein [Candidatus Latescibacterota bacterium]